MFGYKEGEGSRSKFLFPLLALFFVVSLEHARAGGGGEAQSPAGQLLARAENISPGKQGGGTGHAVDLPVFISVFHPYFTNASNVLNGTNALHSPNLSSMR